MRYVLVILIVLSLVVAAPALAFDIVGVGWNPSKAQTDAFRQIVECFGRVRVTSETKVRDYQTVSDEVDIQVHFSASNLDKFYVGMSKFGDDYKVVYRFPDSLLTRTKGLRRDYYKKMVFITFERVGYSVHAIDSFGEESRKGFEFKVPKGVRRFVRRFIWRISDDFMGFEWVQEMN